MPDYISLAVDNEAIAGRSARSFTREGRFDTIAGQVKSGDFVGMSSDYDSAGSDADLCYYVVIEFGHNDGGSLTPTDNGRTDCSPVGTDYSVTCTTVYE